MATAAILPNRGYRGEAAPNRFLHPKDAIDRLAVFLPGFRVFSILDCSWNLAVLKR